MPTTSFPFEGEVTLTYDENSAEFQEALESYRELIQGEDATAADMLRYVAGNLSEWSDAQRMIEGVGYVAVEGLEVPKDTFSGITVAQGFEDRHFD